MQHEFSANSDLSIARRQMRWGRRSRWLSWTVLGSFALAYAVLMLGMGGATLTRLYGPSPYHRLQADALVQGRLNFAESPIELQQNLVLHDGKVQHVWGLGVGLWLAPFEAIWRLFGQIGFPDRVAMGVAFALLAAYGGTTGRRLSELHGKRLVGIGFTALILLCPAVLQLNCGRRLVYEETVLYACLVSLGILVAVIRVACFNRHGDFYVCAVLAAWSGLVRPTHAIYGLLGVTICGIILSMRKAGKLHLSCGSGIYVAGLLILLGTNWLRFGAPLEFGHNLTMTNGAMVYFTRFDNPFQSASLWEANKELAGALFLPNEVQGGSAEDPVAGQMFRAGMGEKVVKGQAKEARWRDMYMSTFDWSYAIVGLAGFVGAMQLVKKRMYSGWHAIQEPTETLQMSLMAWSTISLLVLWCFYLYFPILSARYLLDFAPAFAGIFVYVWLNVSFCGLKPATNLRVKITHP